jgi:fumarate hydratase class I
MAQVAITTPLDEATARSLRAGDEVTITGLLYTGRDAVHKYLAGGGELPEGVDLTGAIVYHCGPVVIESVGADGTRQFTVTAAGPTTSIREEPYQAGIIEKFGIRGVIGKGGMGKKTLDACKQFGAVYLHAVGGAAQVYADAIQGVEGVFLEEFGAPEAIWIFRVKDFPVIVTMDSHGESLHSVVQTNSLTNLQAALND